MDKKELLQMCSRLLESARTNYKKYSSLYDKDKSSTSLRSNVLF